MKKKKLSLFIMIIVGCLVLTGCTTYLKDDNKKQIKNPVTDQNIVKNVLCQPTDKAAKEIYNEYKIEINSLPKCTEMTLTSGGYDGLWTSFFVKPLAWSILQIGKFVNNNGLALIITSLIIRLIAFPITRKSSIQSEMMKKAKPDMDRIEAKYKDKSDNASMMKKSQEMSMIYKKYNINPISGCLMAFLQLPLFVAFLEAINRVPAIFEESFLGLQLGTTPLNAITNGKPYLIVYILLIIIVIGSTFLSFKLNAAMNADNSQFKMMMNVMLVMITVMSVVTSSALGIYWITTNMFTVIQNLVVKKVKVA